MSRVQVGDVVKIDDRPARLVWLRANANEIEPMDEYIVEFEDKPRRFVVGSAPESKQAASIHDRKP